MPAVRYIKLVRPVNLDGLHGGSYAAPGDVLPATIEVADELIAHGVARTPVVATARLHPDLAAHDHMVALWELYGGEPFDVGADEAHIMDYVIDRIR